MQVLHLHDQNPMHPFPSIAHAAPSTPLRDKKVKVAVELLPLPASEHPFDIPSRDQLGSPARRQPWLSSIMFSHESKRRIFARSKLNHCDSTTSRPLSGKAAPRSPRAQQNTPAISRISTAAVDTVLSLRALRTLEPNISNIASSAFPDVAKENRKEPAAGFVSDRSHRALRFQFPDTMLNWQEQVNVDKVKSVAVVNLRAPLSSASVGDLKDKDLQVLDAPVLNFYEVSNGQGALFMQGKTPPITPRVPGYQKYRPPVINLCDPAVPPLKLPLDGHQVCRSNDGKDPVLSERKLRFSKPNDTYYQVRGSQTERLLRAFVPYPIAVANVAYALEASPFVSEVNVGFPEPKAPPRSAKSSGSTPRSPMMSRTVFQPSSQEAPSASAAQPAKSPKPKDHKDHIVTAEMQMKGILIDAGAVSVSLFDPAFDHATPLYVGAGPKSKASNGISDKVWSRTLKNAGEK
jgi:hypothetical protein